MSTPGSLPAFTLVVPCYNEAERFDEFGHPLVDFVAGLAAESELIFVDDGSDDATPELVASLVARNRGRAVRILRLGHRGNGAAVAAGQRAGKAPMPPSVTSTSRHRLTSSSG